MNNTEAVISEIRKAERWVSVDELVATCHIRRTSVIRCANKLSTRWDILVRDWEVGKYNRKHCIYRMNPKYLPNPQSHRA